MYQKSTLRDIVGGLEKFLKYPRTVFLKGPLWEVLKTPEIINYTVHIESSKNSLKIRF